MWICGQFVRDVWRVSFWEDVGGNKLRLSTALPQNTAGCLWQQLTGSLFRVTITLLPGQSRGGSGRKDSPKRTGDRKATARPGRRRRRGASGGRFYSETAG